MKLTKAIKHISILTLVLSLSLLATGCGNQVANLPAKTSDQLLVVGTIFPNYDFAKAVGKNHVTVKLLLPPGAEAHHFEPSPQDLMLLKEADVFIYTSDAMEPWAKKLISQVGKNTVVIEASKGVKMLSSSDLGVSGELVEHEDGDGHGDEHGGVDPHIWLDPSNAEVMASNIEAGMAKAKPELKNELEANLKAYQGELEALNQAYTERLAKYNQKSLMFAGHFAFGYMAHKWDIAIYSPYQGFSPDAEPSGQKIAQMVDLMKAKHIKTVYYEELIDPKIARVMSSETGADMVMLHAAHNVSKEELTNGVTYLDIMKSNLNKLEAGFKK